MFQTARRRLVAWNVSVVGLILLILGAIVYTMFSSQVYKSVDQQLQSQAISDVNLLQRSGDVSAIVNANWVDTTTFRTIVTDANGQVDLTSDCPYLVIVYQQCRKDAATPISTDSIRDAVTSGKDIRTTWFRHSPQRVLTFAVEVGGTPRVIQLSRAATGEETALNELRVLLILGGLIGLFLTGVGSLFLAGRALVPIGAAFRRQRQFTADASHELRTPLALIRANAEMLQRHSDHLPPDDAELIGEIILETDHLNRLVGDLLTLARADSDSIQLKTEPVDLRALVEGVHEDLRFIAESHDIQTSLSLDGPVTVQGDEGRLRQLLLILFDNALKYTDHGGRVDVSLGRADSNNARLTVSDTGIGISARDIPHVFDRFYRADRARQHESGGTGLGLAIAKWIVTAHGGAIKVDSELGKGTRFQVELPARQA